MNIYNNELDWSQKYRPTCMEEMILPADIKSRLEKVATEKGGISLLLHGRSGMGKTTFAKLVNSENVFYVNCTKDSSVAMVKNIERTCSSVTFYGRRLILLDEADYLTENAQAALRGVVEQMSLTNDFIMTANKPERLSEAIKSRFLPVNFDFLRTEEFIEDLVIHLWAIAAGEGYGDTDKKLLEVIVKTNFPDIRKMIKTLQYELG